MRNFNYLPSSEFKPFLFDNLKDIILRFRSALFFMLLWMLAIPGLSQTFSTSAPEIFTNGNSDATNNLEFLLLMPVFFF